MSMCDKCQSKKAASMTGLLEVFEAFQRDNLGAIRRELEDLSDIDVLSDMQSQLESGDSDMVLENVIYFEKHLGALNSAVLSGQERIAHIKSQVS